MWKRTWFCVDFFLLTSIFFFGILAEQDLQKERKRKTNMKLTLQRKLRAICIPTALSFILTVPLLVSCSDNGNEEETTALLVSDDTTETPTDTYLEQEESITNGNQETESTPSSGNNVNVGNATTGSNDSKGLSFVSNGNGTCTLTGMGTCTDVCLVVPTYSPSGDRVTAISEKAFYGCTAITAVFLPASVTSIGSMAFAACPSLAYFSVDASNTTYRSEGGILYNADRSTLLSYPAAKSTSVASIPSSVTIIADMAFYGCTKLTGISYAGTQTDWQKISIGSGNNSLFGLGVQYNSSAGK